MHPSMRENAGFAGPSAVKLPDGALRFRRRVTDGEWRMASRGSKLTIHDVAIAAGVSTGTVSRVLNENTTVRPDIRRKVQQAIDKLGYTPNAVARSMRSTGISPGASR